MYLSSAFRSVERNIAMYKRRNAIFLYKDRITTMTNYYPRTYYRVKKTEMISSGRSRHERAARTKIEVDHRWFS